MTTSVYEILKELNESNSSNYKLEVLKKYQDNELLKRVLSLTNDKVKYNFGIGKTTLYKFTNKDYYDKTYVPYVEKANAEKKQKILSLINKKNEESLENMSKEELEKMLENI